MWYANPNKKIVEQSKIINHLEYKLENERKLYGDLSNKAVTLERALNGTQAVLKRKVDAYDAELGHVGAKLVRREVEIDFLAGWLTEAKEERDRLSLELYDVKSAYQGYVHIVAKQDAVIAQNKEAIEATDRRYGQLLAERDHAEGQLQLALGRNEGLAAERTIIEDANDSLRQQLAAGETEFARLEGEIKELRTELMPLRDSYANCKRESQQWYERWEQRGAKIVEHEKYIDSVVRDNHRQVETIDKLQEELKQANAHDQRQVDLIDQLRHEANPIDGLRYQLKEVATDAKVQKARADGLESALDDHLEKLANLKHDYDRKRDEASALDSEVGSLQWELDNQRDAKVYWGVLAVMSIIGNAILIGLPYARAFTH